MKNQPFWRRHASIIFSMSTLIISVGCAVLSLFLEQTHKFISTLTSDFASMGIAAFVASMFFNFRDVREIIAGSISSLLLDGDIGRHLTPNDRKHLRTRLLEEDYSENITYIPIDILEHMDNVRDHCLTGPHLYNDAITINLSDIEGRPDLIKKHLSRTYSVNCRHLKNSCGKFPLRIRSEISDPQGRMTVDQMLTFFELKVGGETFTKNDISICKRYSGATETALISFDKDISVEHEVMVSFSFEVTSDPNDSTEIIYAWYPTKGFRATLLYKEGMAYDVAWFRSWNRVPNDYPWREQVEVLPTGITAYTHEWLLPGHGTILYWFNKNIRQC